MLKIRVHFLDLLTIYPLNPATKKRQMAHLVSVPRSVRANAIALPLVLDHPDFGNSRITEFA